MSVFIFSKPGNLFMISFLLCACVNDRDFSRPEKLSSPPSSAPGFPSRAADLDVWPGFQSPPAGYGEVPFWWWSGDPLDKDRLLWQIEELHKKGITGLQVNYIHQDTPGWPTYPAEPEIFSDEWWDMWTFAADECRKRNMGLGLSGYTLDWPKGDNLFNRIVYNNPEIRGREIQKETVLRVLASTPVSLPVSTDAIAVWAYPVADGVLRPGGMDLSEHVRDHRLSWTPPEGTWEIWVFTAARKPGTLNPIHPLAGKTVVDKFFQPFQRHAAGQSAEGLNYFFQDELQFGVGDVIWADDFRVEFKKRKGYDVFEVLPALFTDIGPVTPKARLDFMDVKVTLSEERYFIPIFDWHWSRGKIYGCDPDGRGLEPGKYGDNFRIQRWYTAPGHDTPGGQADLIKGKVSSSIAALYNRPRVWLEGYHSLGWGATPERLMHATSENFLYGCNLLNLHGLYYTTHGSFWEWAPPCYHFRMPYWDHLAVFLKYFERLSYLLSQGVLQADIAIMYPVSPVQARMDGDKSTETAFQSGRELFAQGFDFVFLDDQSLERAVIDGGKLEVSDLKFKVLVLPSMKAVRWSTLQKALEFQRRGGIVVNVGSLPEAGDHAGSEDPELDLAVRELFGVSASESGTGKNLDRKTSAAGGLGIAVESPADLMRLIGGLLPKVVESDPPVRAMHRRIGFRDVYMVMDAPIGSWCAFRSKGKAELWDPWTGKTFPLEETVDIENGTKVRMPLDRDQAQIIVFSPSATPSAEARGAKRMSLVQRSSSLSSPETLTLDGDWEFELRPTMDNRWGDFRLPATERMIGAEARIFRYAEENGKAEGWERSDFDDSSWFRQTGGFGRKFWKLGPLPAEADFAAFEKEFSSLNRIDPARPVKINGKNYFWTSYDFSWRWGRDGDPGHQGWHGLKETVTDEFICLGKPVEGYNEILYQQESAGRRYYLWTNAYADRSCEATADIGGLSPTAVYLNGKSVAGLRADFKIDPGPNPLLLRYDAPGRGHFVLLKKEAPEPAARTPLSMTWGDLSGRIPFDVRGGESSPAGWYRFTAPPGLKKISVRASSGLRVWVDGRELSASAVPEGRMVRYEFPLEQIPGRRSTIAIRLEQVRGEYGGSGLPEPILLDCGPGLSEAGDWSQGSVLENYSGGAWYRKNVILTPGQAKAGVLLDLGDIVATAEIRVNGTTAGILVCPPWKADISEFIKAGDNRIEILVYNTLSNHYLTVPSRYKGSSLRSGLIGPVRLNFYPRR